MTASTPPTVSEAMREAVAPVTRAEVRACIGETVPLRRRWVDKLMAGPIARLSSALAALERENATLQERLEISHAYNLDGDKVPFPEGMPDGIECRDETIRNLEDINATLQAERDEAIARAREPIGDTWDQIRHLEGECRVFIRERNEWKAVADRAEAKADTLRASAERMEAALKAAETRFSDIAAGNAFQPRLHAATGATEARTALNPKETPDA